MAAIMSRLNVLTAHILAKLIYVHIVPNEPSQVWFAFLKTFNIADVDEPFILMIDISNEYIEMFANSYGIFL